MPTYEITGPDGKKYRVTGDNPEGAMQALQEHIGAAPQTSDFKQPVDASTVYVDEMLFGLPGKAAAAMNAAIRAPFTDKTFGEEYQAQRQGYNRAREQYAEDHPIVNTAATLGGAIGGPVGGVTTGLKAGRLLADAVAPSVAKKLESSLVGRIGADAAGGAVIGGTSAYGHDQNIGAGALIGGALGGAARPVVEAGGGVLNAVGGMMGLGNKGRAQQAIYEAFTRAGKSGDDVANDLRAAAAEGQPEFMVADALGHSGQRMLSGIARAPGDMRQTIAETLQRRQAGQGDRLVNALSEGFNAPKTAQQTRAAMEAKRAADANVNYGAARASAGTVDPSRAIQAADEFLQPGASSVMRNASGIADDSIESAVRRARSYLTDGKSVLTDFNAALRAKQEIDAMIEGAKPAVQRQLAPIRSALDDALADASPDYAAARDAYRQQSKAIEAIDTGRGATAGRTRAEDNIDLFRSMSPEEQQAFRVGYADPLIARVESASISPTTNKARPLITGKTGAEFPEFAAPGQAERMGNRIAREQRMFETANAVLGGSRTADNLADMTEMGVFDPSMVTALLSGNFKGAAVQGLVRGAQKLSGRNQQTRDLIAKALLQTSPTKATAEIADAIEAGKKLSEKQQLIVNMLIGASVPRAAAMN